MDPAQPKLHDAHPFPGTSPIAVVSAKSTAGTATATLPEATPPHLPAEQTNLDLQESLKNEDGQPIQVDGSVQVNAPVEAIPAQQDTALSDAIETPPASQHSVPEHVHDGEPSQHMQEITDGLQHDLQQGADVPQPVSDGRLTEEGKDAVAVQQQQVAQPEESVHSSEHVHGSAAEVVEASQHDGAVHSHVQHTQEQEVPHEQLQQQIEGEEVQPAEHHPPIQQEGVIHTTQHEQGHKMEEVIQQPLQEAAQPLEQEHEHAQMQAQGHHMREPTQEQYQEHVPPEHHEQAQEQLTEQQHLQPQEQEQLVEHHPEHEQAQVQEHHVPDHNQDTQTQEIQEQHDAIQQQMNPALATAAAAAAAAVAPSEKVVYEQVMEHARYQQQQPIANAIDSPRQAPPMSSPETTPRRGAERYHASGEQLRTLVEAFEQDPTPSVQTLNFLSSSIGMPMHNLVLWFKNRRARHKKTHPNQPLKSGRRSYVKSGIYSRSKRGKQRQQAAVSIGLPTTMQHSTHQQIPPGMMLPPDPMDGQAVPDLPQDQKQVIHSSIRGDLAGTKRPHDEQGMVGPTLPKRTKYVGVKELIGDENPCRLWDGQDCHRRCVEFFERTSGGCHREQANAARIVSAEFFLSELQSGLTMTSAMQTLETSVAILDDIMDRLPTEGPKLSSGSRVILREFFAQMRSGNAATTQPESNIEEAGVNLANASPEEIAAGEIAEEEHPAEENASEENAPEENAPEENAPEENAPEENAPEENAPEENAPEENATEENAPEEDAPEEDAADENVAGDNTATDSNDNAGVEEVAGENAGGDGGGGEHEASEVAATEAAALAEQQTQ